MITIKNQTTNETINVGEIMYNGGVIHARWAFPEPSNKKLAKGHLCRTEQTVRDEKHGVDCRVLTLEEGWEIVETEKKPRQPKAAAEPTAEPTPEKPRKQRKSNKPATPAAEPTTPAEPAAEPITEPATPATPAEPAAAEPATDPSDDNIDATAAAIAAALRGAKLAQQQTVVDEATVEAIVRRIIAEQPQQASNTVEVKVVGSAATNKVADPHPLLKKVLSLVVNDRVTGRYPWLFGPAGSGKSTLAKQVADALGLPFYSVSSLQQKYELEGYTDATGELVKTVFYKAAKEGGVFLFDEASTTSGEVQVAFNSMLANLWYNFPKEGMVTAHKDFHIIAADNTTGRGGNSTYSARFQMDASTLDRYTCIEVGYTDQQDNSMSENDSELVTFIRDLRAAIADARLTYTASPRALRAIKAHQKMDVFTEQEAFELGLCSGWNKQDIRTLSARLHGTNKYYRMFAAAAK